MARIKQLDPHVADLIAAGEVVERPGSVVKELIENSIDAGADALTVEIKNGGMSYIRVSDNGCGMSPEDAKTAFLRHATSKLRDERGLEAIGTLGFRGEALAAIAAVSRVELLTREPGAAEGVSLTLEAGEIKEELPAGCPEGTTIVVRELFFNTPARLKYMKKDSAEGAAASAAVIRCALSHPEVSIRYIKDGEEEAHTPGDGNIEACVYSIFGAAFSKGLLEAKSEDDDISVRGLVTAPAVSRGNRGWQFF
ncbi:MAG: ATP-binding protein, partial [Oscillospiraceae bacterium]|nr:ATP-binding protein [Oscillospiraceae bacterium]